MAFTSQGLNLFLTQFKSAIDTSGTTLVARARSTGNFIAGDTATFGAISNNAMDLSSPVVFNIPPSSDVGSISLFQGTVTNQSTMLGATQLAQVSFSPGTYVFSSNGTLTISEFKITAQN